MIGRYDRDAFIIVSLSAETIYPFGCAKKRLYGGSARTQNGLGRQELNLTLQIWETSSALLRRGFPVVRRSALYHIGDIAVRFPRQPY